jgi:subtilisin
VGGVSCRGKKQDFADVAGHGTLVGGWIGAVDNDIGVVGVAPGARLWAVRVFDRHGFGPNSAIICGLDWATGTRLDSDPTNDIAVANMSLGGPAGKATGNCLAAPKDAFHDAVCRTITAGITVVAAAGNDSVDFQDIAPATYDEVLTATAMADRDGQPGGLGGQFMCDPAEFDDTPATFTNFATLPSDQAHTIAAPGVCISSTSPGGQYGIGSGTSFAAPHVAGTVALCIWSGPCAGLTPQQITEKIVADAAAYNTANPGYGFEGDPLRPESGKYYGYLIRAAQY